MSKQPLNQPLLPTDAIAPDNSLNATNENWFEYPVRAQPHHTDYAGIVWHGSYLTWMEEARVECLRTKGIEFADLVNMGCDLPVVEIALRYHRPIKMGKEAIVKTRMTEIEGVRIYFDYEIQSPDREEIYLTGKVTLVAIDREKGKILRQLPPAVKDALIKIS